MPREAVSQVNPLCPLGKYYGRCKKCRTTDCRIKRITKRIGYNRFEEILIPELTILRPKMANMAMPKGVRPVI